MANIVANVIDGNNLNLVVTPSATQIITIDRGVAGSQGPPGPPGPPGPSGTSTIGGYPVSLSNPQNLDALMFLNSNWTNIPQTEISDGGNF
jgi:hypothetical protein